MAEEARRRAIELIDREGNTSCAECGVKDVACASVNLGIFLCNACGKYHRNLGCHKSRVKYFKLDKWEDDDVRNLEEWGNLKANAKYEAKIPACYKRPNACTVPVLMEQWVRAKYEREEFIFPDKQIYTVGQMEGYLLKRGRQDQSFRPRKFVLNESEDTLKYYVKENSKKDAKAVMKLSNLNATFCPKKIDNPNVLQISWANEGSTRSIFVYSEGGKEIVDWYMAIRSAKLHLLEVAYPGMDQYLLAQSLSRDFLNDGWLYKTGPKGAEAYKKRWFTLDGRKLMYFENPLDPYPIKELILGSRDKFKVKQGLPPGFKERGFPFTLETPDRTYRMGAVTESEREEWMDALKLVIERPITFQESNRMFLGEDPFYTNACLRDGKRNSKWRISKNYPH